MTSSLGQPPRSGTASAPATADNDGSTSSGTDPEPSGDRTTSSQHESSSSHLTQGIRAIIALGGAGLITIAAALVFTPEAVEPALPVEEITQTPLFSDAALRAGVFFGLGVACAVWIVWTTPSWLTDKIDSDTAQSPVDFDALRTDPPEQATETPAIGASFETTVELAKQAAVNNQPDGARNRLRELVGDALVIAEGCSTEEAQSRIENGTWTDDSVAAAYLADRESALPFRQRLIGWLRPAKTKEHRIDRTIEAIVAEFDTFATVSQDEGEHS